MERVIKVFFFDAVWLNIFYAYLKFKVKISDPSNNLVTISNLRVEIKDINVIPLQPVISKKILDEAVSNSFIMSAQNYVEKHVNNNNYSFVANSKFT